MTTLWRNVPDANKNTTAIMHLPLMGHRPDAHTLHAVLPLAVTYVSSGLDPQSRPTSSSLGSLSPILLVTEDCPQGEWLTPHESEPDLPNFSLDDDLQ